MITKFFSSDADMTFSWYNLSVEVRMGYNTKYYKKPKPLSHISLKPLNDTNFQNYLVLELTETAKYYNQNHQVIQNSWSKPLSDINK